ncbi:murein biosynthesis integral membrane protein MurJ [Elioraea sp.]|uniref:murein biosynthesis integral membrane protein MurJ n=1 Tax=Elioraea sp. TaxID=2185103 RepID=UPI00307E3DEF
MIRNVLTVGGWTAASRVLGFLRDILIAAALGAGPAADAFFVALKLPNFFRRLFGEGAFSAAFVPLFAGALAAEGRDQARRVAEGALAVLLVSLAALTALAILFMPQAMGLLAPGFRNDPERFALAVELARITFPYLMLICLVALFSGVLNGLDRFAAAAAAPVLFNVALIGGLVLAPVLALPAVHGLAWGVAAAGLGQFLLLSWAVAAAGLPLRLPLPRLTPEVRLLLRRMGPGAIGAGVTQINLMVDVIIASFLPQGAIAFLYYADRVNQLPLGVLGTAVGTALLPALSRQVRAGDATAALATQNRAIEFALLLTVPAAAGLAIAAWPIVHVLFGRGAFGAEDVAATAAALAAYAVGLPGYVLAKVFAPGFFARGDTASPVKVAVGCVALNIALCLALIGPFGHVGVAMATAITGWVNAGALGAWLWRQGRLVPDGRLGRFVPRLVAAAAVMGAAVWAAQAAIFDALFQVQGYRWGALAALLAVAGAVFAGAALALRVADPRELRGYLKRRRA